MRSIVAILQPDRPAVRCDPYDAAGNVEPICLPVVVLSRRVFYVALPRYRSASVNHAE
jgi:hypothetical protein